MKILHVITSLRTGGAEKLMVDLLPRLKQKGYDVDILLFDGTETPFKRELEKHGINVLYTFVGKSVYSHRNILKLRKLFRNYDVIHTHNYAPQLFAAIASYGKTVKLVTTEHSGSNRRRKFKIFAAIDRWMYNQYNRVICIADKTLENLKSFIGSRVDNFLVINNGVDVNKYISATASAELEKLAPHNPKLLMVAGFRWEKDQDTVIKSLQYLPSKFHLFLVGDGVRKLELETLAMDYSLINRVHFLGVRTDVPNLLHAADYIIMSSHFEGLSLSSVEGMSVGKPFLASDVDGLREVVNGAGILFPHQDAEALAKEILKLDEDSTLYKAVADACEERARQYDISKMVDGYLKVYESLNKTVHD